MNFKLKSTLSLLFLLGVFGLTACGNKENKSAQVQPTQESSTVQFSFGDDKPQGSDVQALANTAKDPAKKEFFDYKGKQLRIVDPSTQTPPNKYGLVYRKGLIREWIDLGGDNSSGQALLKMKLHVIDLMLGGGEGNSGFDSKNWYMTKNHTVHIDPGYTARPDGFGRVNTGFVSVNCFMDRPTDQQIRKYCAEVFKYKGLSVAQVAAMNIDQLRDLYYETKLPILLGNDYAVGFKSNAESVLNKLNAAGLLADFSLTENLFFIDQANQLGLGGVSELIKEYKSLNKTGADGKQIPPTKESLLKSMQKLKIIGEDNIFYTGYGFPVNLNEVTRAQIQLAYSRVIYHNTRGSSTVFDSPQSWLTKAAHKWTYNSLKKDYPNMHTDIGTELKKIDPKVDLDNAFYGGIQKGDQIEVFAKVGTKIVVTKKYKPLGKSRAYTAAQVAFGDPFRRLSTLPQTSEQLDAMIKDTPRFLKEDFYGFYNVK
jgi:hypothetical protein